MSDAYKFSFKTDLQIDLSTCEIKTLEFLMGVSDERPSVLPKHVFFKDGLSKSSFKEPYRDFPPQAYACNVWTETTRSGDLSRRAVDLYLPSQKLEDIYQDCLPFAAWLASLSVKNGFAGSFRLSDSEDFNPTLLFVSKSELYFGDMNEAHSFITGKKLARG